MQLLTAEATRTAGLAFTFRGANLAAFENERPLERVSRYLRAHLSQPLSLGQAARIAGLERTYFSAYFHRKVGVTFVRWVNAVRVARAIELLSETNRGISEVATECGYREARSLQRNFKTLTGMTPSRFRAQLRRRAVAPCLDAAASAARYDPAGLRLVSRPLVASHAR